MSAVQVNGRAIDNSCPYMGRCWADGYCEGTCPPTAYDKLRRSAELEHELNLTPHTDPDLKAVCARCQP